MIDEEFIKNNELRLMVFRRTFELFTAKNTVISPNFLVWKFCGKGQFPREFLANHKISTPGN